jgi:hypothetical protein
VVAWFSFFAFSRHSVYIYYQKENQNMLNAVIPQQTDRGTIVERGRFNLPLFAGHKTPDFRYVVIERQAGDPAVPDG